MKKVFEIKEKQQQEMENIYIENLINRTRNNIMSVPQKLLTYNGTYRREPNHVKEIKYNFYCFRRRIKDRS